MLNIVLFELEILFNIGNIMCLVVNIGVVLYLIELFGFELDEWCLCCVGLDYSEYVNVIVYLDY